MNTFEDRMTEAADALAEAITAQNIPPLKLRLRRRWFPAPGGRPRRVMGWLAPLAAAAAVVGIVAASLVIADDHGTGRPSPPASSGGPLAGVPAYYVYMTFNSHQDPVGANIVATATGHVLTTVRPPRGYVKFTVEGVEDNVAVAGSDRSFVLQALTKAAPDGDSKLQFFLVRFSPQRLSTAVRPLLRRPLAVGADIQFGGDEIALSPDGTKLAYAAENYTSAARITVLTLATGASRSWVNRLNLGAGQDSVPPLQSLSWSARGEVQYIEHATVAGKPGDVRYRYGLLNPASTGAALPAGTPIPAGLADGFVTPGNYLINCAQGDPVKPAHRTAGWGLSEYTLPAAHRVDNLGLVSPLGEASGVFWSNTTGSVLIVPYFNQNGTSARMGVIRDGRYRPLPAPPGFVRFGGIPTW